MGMWNRRSEDEDDEENQHFFSEEGERGGVAHSFWRTFLGWGQEKLFHGRCAHGSETNQSVRGRDAGDWASPIFV
jgi:hypothetical protein